MGISPMFLWRTGTRWPKILTKTALLTKPLKQLTVLLHPSPLILLSQACSKSPLLLYICPNPTPGHPVPMDAGLYQKKNPALITCYWCGESRHKVPDCPLNFNIQSWSMEEIEMELMARKDLAKTESLALKPEENPISEEDFVQDNEWKACPRCLLVIILRFCQIYMIPKWFP